MPYSLSSMENREKIRRSPFISLRKFHTRKGEKEKKFAHNLVFSNDDNCQKYDDA